jgi:hypothetical protein
MKKAYHFLLWDIDYRLDLKERRQSYVEVHSADIRQKHPLGPFFCGGCGALPMGRCAQHCTAPPL